MEDPSRRGSRAGRAKSAPSTVCTCSQTALHFDDGDVDYIPPMAFFGRNSENIFFSPKFRFGLLQEDLMCMYQKKTFMNMGVLKHLK